MEGSMPVGDSSAVVKPGSPMVWSSTRLGGDRRFFSTWSALGNPVFRKLWIAAVISGTCVAAHDTAAMWMMNMLTPSPFLISLLSTVASLPFFLFTLPAGALADIVDRKKLLCVVNLWLAGAVFIIPWLRARYSPNTLVVSANLLVVLVYV